MAAPERAEAVRVLDEGCSIVARLLAGVGDDDAVRPGTIGGGTWSARDLVGHLAFWEELAIEALGQARGATRPRVEAAFAAGAAGVDALNEENYQRTLTQSWEGARTRKAASHAAIAAAIGDMGDGEWRAKIHDAGDRRRSTAELLGSVLGAPKRPFGHAWAHIPDLESFVSTLR